MPDPLIYESWGDLNAMEPLPQRSYLYRLQPIGVGSAYVESLTGYIARLAEAHSVATGALLALELQPRVLSASGAAGERARVRNASFVYDAHILNGLGESPRQWVSVLESLTGRDSLHTLTMLSWGQVISHCNLLRHRRAWCPQCYDSWRRANLPIYEPLLWSISAAAVCPIHGRPLERYCPHCKRESPLLTAKARPGYCYRCRGWLGAPVQPELAVSAGIAELPIASTVGDLLALGPAIQGAVSGAYFKENLVYGIGSLADGNQSVFSRATGVSRESLTDWLNPNTTFRLRPFLWMCSELGIPAARILTARIPADDPGWERARDLFARRSPFIWRFRRKSQVQRALQEALNSAVPTSLREVAQQLGYRSIQALRNREQKLCNEVVKKHGNIGCAPAPRRKRSTYPAPEMVRKALEQALGDSNHRSLNVIAKQLGYRHAYPLYRFPDLCHALFIKNRSWREQEHQRIRDAISKALDQESVPTLKEIAGRLGSRPHVLHRHFPDLYAALIARRPERKQLERERIRKQLEDALEQNPAPSMQVVAQSVGREQGYLRILFADLHEKIKCRYIERQKTERSQTKVRFLAQVRVAAIELRKRGINPSRKHVFSAIENPSMKSTQGLSRYIAQILTETEAGSCACSSK